MKKTFYLFCAAMGLTLIFGLASCASSPKAEDQLVEDVEDIEDAEDVENVEDVEEPQPVVAREEGPMDTATAEIFSQIEEARRAAEQAGAGDYYPDQLEAANLAARMSRDLLNSGNSDGAISEGRKALAWYQMLKNGMEIRELRQKILEYGFDAEDPEGFADAEAKYGEAMEKFELEPQQSLELSRQAIAAYWTVCNNGFMGIAAEEKARALENIELCNSIKADRSMPDEYQAASGTFSRAESLAEQNTWEDACKAYRDASNLFAGVYQNAMYKRELAEKAMNAARARQAASTALALEADAIAPLPDEDAEAGNGEEHSNENEEAAE